MLHVRADFPHAYPNEKEYFDLDFETFKKELWKLVQKKIGPQIQVSIRKVPKNNGIWQEGIVFEKEGEYTSPILYLEEYYALWEEGVSMDLLAEKMLWSYEEYGDRFQVPRDFFQNYNELKPRIYYRLINYERNRELLKKLPHRRILDLAMVFYYEMETEDPIATILIQNSHLDMWKITGQELEKNAREATAACLPARLLSMEEILEQECGETLDDGEEKGLYILTNGRQRLGAGVILYPGVLEEISLLLGDHFYILPSSIHECILVSQKMQFEQEDLVQMVTQINEKHVDPREVLADQAYYYLREDGKIHF